MYAKPRLWNETSFLFYRCTTSSVLSYCHCLPGLASIAIKVSMKTTGDLKTDNLSLAQPTMPKLFYDDGLVTLKHNILNKMHSNCCKKNIKLETRHQQILSKISTNVRTVVESETFADAEAV